MSHAHHPDRCVTCTACVVQCPVTMMDRKFSGPKMLGPAMERFRLFDEEDNPSLEYCSNCKNCDITCPSGVPISTLNMIAKGKQYQRKGHRLRDWILSHGEVMGKMAAKLPWAANLGMNMGLSRLMMAQIGISRQAPMPAYASRTFGEAFRQLRQQPREEKVVFFPGCYIEYNDPEVGVDLVKLLNLAGVEVVVPEGFRCCGSPLVTGGYLDEAEQNVKKNAEIMEFWTSQGVPVLTCCTSCSLMLKQENRELFPVPGLENIAARIYDSTEYVADLIAAGRLALPRATAQERYLYHAPCHLRAQGIGSPSLELLQQCGVAVEDADAGCCGISGNYGFRDDRYEVAMAVGEKLFQRVKGSGVRTVLSDCGTCRLQIGHGSGAKTAHPISILCKLAEEAR